MADPIWPDLPTVSVRLLQGGGALLLAVIGYVARGAFVTANALSTAIRDLDGILADTAPWWSTPMTSAAMRRDGAVIEVKKQSDRLRESVNHLGAVSTAVEWRRLWVLLCRIPAQADVQAAQ